MKITKILLAFLFLTIIFLVSCTFQKEHANEKEVIVLEKQNITAEKDLKDENNISNTNNEEIIQEKEFDTSKAVKDENGCYDSEGGIFYEKKGYIIDIDNIRFEDECLSKSTLVDVYCGLIGYKDESMTNCEFGCENGQCLPESDSTMKCVDSDFEDYYNKGDVFYEGKTFYDYCEDDNNLKEQICTIVGIASEKEKYCQYGCDNGACVEGTEEDSSSLSCADSDAGPDEQYTKGTVTDPKGTVEDYCLNTGTVKEFKCSSVGFRRYMNIECDNGCLDGACIR